MNINSLSIYSYEFEKIYVGFSGGADSTALLLLLQAAASNSSLNSFKFEAIHFEHGLRGEESLQDAAWCRNFCEIRNIPFREVAFNMNPEGSNIEAEARQRRMDFWQENVISEKEAVALGHHADDKIENMLLRLCRGSNCTGLTALRNCRIIGGVTFLRPLLSYRRSEIEEFLKKEGVTDWREDSTNQELKHNRCIIRNAVLPQLKKFFPVADKAILKSLDALEKDADFLELEAARIFEEIKDRKDIEIDKMASMHPALLVRVLRLWMTRHLNQEFIPSVDFMNRFESDVARFSNKNLATGERKSIPIFNSCALVFEKGMLRLETDFETAIMSLNMVIWNWGKKPKIKYGGYEFTAFLTDNLEESFFQERTHEIVCFDADKFPENLIIRSREPGDEIIPFGRETPTSIKKLLEDTALLTAEKSNIPVVTGPEGVIIWIPGVRRANFANIEIDRTRQVQQGNFIILKSEKAEADVN